MRRTGPAEAAAALAEAGAIGPYFIIDTGEPTDGWHDLNSLYRNKDSALDELVTTYATRLPTHERRVAASILFQGYAARLWSPFMACLAKNLPLPILPIGHLHWRYQPGEPFGLLTTHPDAWEVVENNSEVLTESVVRTHLRPMVTALRQLVPVAENLLWGNAASALAGTLTVLHAASVPTATATTVTARLLDIPPLCGTGTLTRTAGRSPSFRRRGCCLYYRIPGGGLCGDCGLRRNPNT